jgi:hypothetical protein
MTISEYLQNPYGKGSAFSSNTKQKDDLDNQFKDISEKIVSKIYRYRDFVIYHVVIPSTKKDNVNYDVVVEVETKNLKEGSANLEGINFRVFSNCPSFIFTYAHVFRGHGMICEWLLSKYNKEVRTKAPVNRNQYGILGLERSVYLALKHLHASGKTKFGVYQTAGKKVPGRNEIINAVRTQQQVMDKVKEKVKEESSNDPSKFGSKSLATNPHSNKDKTTKTTLFTKSVKNIKTGKNTTKTKTSKTVKKI